VTPSAWFTTTKLEDRLNPDGRSPLGVRHAKKEGAQHTACGLPALNWKLFWHLPFRATDAEACPDCREAVVLLEASGRT